MDKDLSFSHRPELSFWLTSRISPKKIFCVLFLAPTWKAFVAMQQNFDLRMMLFNKPLERCYFVETLKATFNKIKLRVNLWKVPDSVAKVSSLLTVEVAQLVSKGKRQKKCKFNDIEPKRSRGIKTNCGAIDMGFLGTQSNKFLQKWKNKKNNHIIFSNICMQDVRVENQRALMC